MGSRPMTRATLIDQCESILQDTGNATWTAAELGLLLDDAITEVSEYVPYVMRDVYQLETRTGSSTTTSASNLVDAGEAQFLSTDVGKVIYNVTDKTWAVVTTYSSTSQVGLSKDIFITGEQYEMYNAGCWAKNQVNLNNSDDLLWIVKVAYPVDRADSRRESLRNWTLVRRTEFDNILEIDAAFLDDTKNSDADKDVYVYCAKQHKLNDMTDLVGAVNNGGGYAAAATSMAVNGLQTTGTLLKDTLFYFTQIGGVTANSRDIYRVTADATISGSATTISFYPGLETAVINADDITFIGSTLTPDIERLIVQIVCGEALMSQGLSKIDVFSRGGTGTPQRYYDIGERMTEKARRKLKSLVDVELRSVGIYSRS